MKTEMKTLAQLREKLHQAMGKSESEREKRERRYEFVGGPLGSGRTQEKKPESNPPMLSSLERVIETLANTHVQNTLMLSGFQLQASRQQEAMAEQMQLDRELAREKAKIDAEAAKEIREATMNFQEQQVASQAATNEVLLKISKASGEHRTRIKTEVSAAGAESAVSLFFELVDFDRNMTELQIGESDYAPPPRSQACGAFHSSPEPSPEHLPAVGADQNLPENAPTWYSDRLDALL